MQEVFEQHLKLTSSDVDCHQILRKSVLFRFLQEISIAHTEALGAGRDKTLDKGALWVVSRMAVQFNRPLRYDEHIVLQSWPGETMHFIFPRYYRILDAAGESVLEASGLWTLIDRTTRKIIFPKELGISIPGADRPGQLELPGGLASPELPEHFTREVQYSDIDLNGHVNNTRYLNWADDLFDEPFHAAHACKLLQINYEKEIRSGETVELLRGHNNQTWFVRGLADGTKAFDLKMDLT